MSERLRALFATARVSLPDDYLELEAKRAQLAAEATQLRRSLPEYDGTERAKLNADAIRQAENAESLADDAVRNYLKTNHASLITDHLRPAFDAVIEEARKYPADSPTTAERAIRVPGGASKYLALETLAARYEAIVRAAQFIYGPGRDSHGLFKDTVTAPERKSGRYNYSDPHGPKETAARLLWLAHEGQPWLPTNKERDGALDRFQSLASMIG